MQQCDYKLYSDYDGGTIVIHRGLSVIVRGHLIDLHQDHTRKVATVRVGVITGHAVTGLEQEDVKFAADLLAKRAQRFLGRQWIVVGWIPPAQECSTGA